MNKSRSTWEKKKVISAMCNSFIHKMKIYKRNKRIQGTVGRKQWCDKNLVIKSNLEAGWVNEKTIYLIMERVLSIGVFHNF